MSLAGTLPPARTNARSRSLLRRFDRWTLHAMNPPRELRSHPGTPGR